ncbi:hypothetical protein [Paracoccus denitrificans]|jgi:hypothetical protein|uniref:hypothetical protein n=1 Tax=Paracoccus denitrificans TaxID=266 RepID=UPI0003122FCE|nr:hypothetical protein [Paracoccus denitrificans]MBB4625794.1 hypothetical protein [Paracoccus denitrificans]MCU7427041.1 hypothetical protein [Paracoccus denitrificans]UPV95502.1 hypothetical protein M0K93_02610 [Paracoccus denitrificans]WQO32433.1 hypothetical protein U0005_08830 [Paracoccus denitrificans]SDJ90309.1 hypothetical protein SAMN04244581_05033 [Paracoccus denitrificans]
MKFTPADVDAMTPWEFLACLEGYGRSKGWKSAQGGGKAMSLERLHELGIE